MESKYINADCMNELNGMPSYPDKYFDIAIVDPPYGIGDYTQSDRKIEVYWNNNTPDANYFKELSRISKEQIIWGANYYNCFPGNRGVIVWDKLQFHPCMSRCEIASCSLQKRITYIQYEWNGKNNRKIDGTMIHPCQKPIELYRWLCQNYCKAGWKILDTHVGGASSLIAYEELGFEYVGYEIDKEYYDESCKRIERHRSQLKLFKPAEIFEEKEQKLFADKT